MVFRQQAFSLFTAAQILRGAPLSVLHFFSPLGAGGAGATLRRVRAAYSRTRCLPRPKGWASALKGRFCVARTYCSYHTFPRTSYLSALRAEVDSIYPARKSNALLCPCPGILPRRNRALFRAKNTPGGWVHLPSLPAFLSAVTFLFVGRKPPPAAVAHKGDNTAFRAFGGIQMPPHPAGGPHKPSQRLTRGSALLGCGVQFRWAAIGGEYRSRKSATRFRIF